MKVLFNLLLLFTLTSFTLSSCSKDDDEWPGAGPDYLDGNPFTDVIFKDAAILKDSTYIQGDWLMLYFLDLDLKEQNFYKTNLENIQSHDSVYFFISKPSLYHYNELPLNSWKDKKLTFIGHGVIDDETHGQVWTVAIDSVISIK